ncbi:IS4 family transposase [Treponema phagedenis]|uniref:IS4 family transposase n=1 Tax=Treponema phagedenis TaxID=162 RepID=UPI0011E81D09|nr:IS4 family transposase [Treponema phagedenis]QEJ94442.1 IS4 family transposase [Treponema phagedenis]
MQQRLIYAVKRSHGLEFRETKGGIKLSIKLDAAGNIPCHAVINNARHHESVDTDKIPFKKNDIVAFDRGYCSFSYFKSLCNSHIYFVTRLKSNIKHQVISTHKESSDKNILSDEIILFTGNAAQGIQDIPFRKIKSYDPDTCKTIIILTNNLSLAASTIAKIYKNRWSIELFFKAIKQNLRIKKFYGRSRSAVLTQIWIALICYLLFAYLKFKTKVDRSFTEFMSVFPTIIFKRICLL